MDFKDIPNVSQPAYTWLWNSHITKEGIKQQIDEMYDSGIRAFYILGEPERFRPTVRRTHLEPKYLSKGFLDLVYYAFQIAKDKGMYMWLYNEGGFPSGMACGMIRDRYPHLAIKELGINYVSMKKGDKYNKPSDVLASFIEEKMLADGTLLKNDCVVCEYSIVVGTGYYSLRTDISNRETTDVFIDMTHEAYKSVFGEHMGKELRLMFDDEAYMGDWTDGFEREFIKKYSYDILPYLPIVSNNLEPNTEEQYRAASDFAMLCGELVRDNYFIPMKNWLNTHNMMSTGHLDLDNFANCASERRYGNVMSIMRAFDVSGIDVIWSQISYPKGGKCCLEGYEFWPRIASSAARHQGHSLCLSESFAVFGSHVTPEEMRFVVNYQAVRGISRFNFMVISYDRDTVMCCQYRPNFIKENPGMDMLSEINDYTARISYILENSKAEIKSALYFPYRSICAKGVIGKDAVKAVEDMGHMLEKQGVDFDIIDEEFVAKATVENHMLKGEYVSYNQVFVPYTEFEPIDIIGKLKDISSEILPCIERKNPYIQARKVVFYDGSSAYLICNTSGEIVHEQVSFDADCPVYRVDSRDGSLVETKYTMEGNKATVNINLLRGEMVVFYLTNKAVNVQKERKLREVATITEVTANVRRQFEMNDKGINNILFEAGKDIEAFKVWDKDFSGEVVYKTIIPELPTDNVIIDLGEVHHFVRIYLNGKAIGEKTMPPYNFNLNHVKCGDELAILVANTAANVYSRTCYFEKQNAWDVGPYHANMLKREIEACSGGLIGPIKVYIDE